MRSRSLGTAPRSRRPKGPLIVALIATVIVVPLVILDLGDGGEKVTGDSARSSSSVPTTAPGATSTTPGSVTSSTAPPTTTIPAVVLNPKWLPKGTIVHGETQQTTFDRAEHRKDLMPTTTISGPTTTISRPTTTRGGR